MKHLIVRFTAILSILFIGLSMTSCGDDEEPNNPYEDKIGVSVKYDGVATIQGEGSPVSNTIDYSLERFLVSDISARFSLRALKFTANVDDMSGGDSKVFNTDVVLENATRVKTLEGWSYTGSNEFVLNSIDGKQWSTKASLRATEDVRGHIRMSVLLKIEGLQSVSIVFEGQR